MEENNNQSISPNTSEIPEVSNIDEIVENNNTEARHVPTLVIEDTQTQEEIATPQESEGRPEVETTQVPSVSEEIVSSELNSTLSEIVPESNESVPESQEVPVASEEPAPAPVASPMDFQIPPSEGSTTNEAPTEIEIATEVNIKPVEEKKKNHNGTALLIIFLCFAVFIVYYLTNNNSSSGQTSAPNSTSTQTIDGSNLSINEVVISGKVFKLPTTLEAFDSINWILGEEYAEINVEPASYVNTVKISGSTGEASLMFYNNGLEAMNIKNCQIYSATFSNPRDGSSEVSFVGKLKFTNSPDEVRNKMKELEYSKPNESSDGSNLTLRYFLNNDTTNINSFIEFNFINNEMDRVTISTAY